MKITITFDVRIVDGYGADCLKQFNGAIRDDIKEQIEQSVDYATNGFGDAENIVVKIDDPA